jgi:2'-5' RNA ligase
LLRETVWIDSFVLYSSLLGRGDPLYRAEADYPLNQDGGHGR